MSAPLRVLIADDDRDFAQALAGLVRACGYEVVATITTGGLEVLRACRFYQPDLVLLDVLLPRLSGITVCHLLRDRFPQVKVVLLSGSHPLRPDARTIAECGAVAFLPKPLLFDELRDALAAAA